jgi:hypothetical protein
LAFNLRSMSNDNASEGPFLYRRVWPVGWSELDIEIACFTDGPIEPDSSGLLGKAEHFWNIVELLWPEGAEKRLERNPWAERMIDHACRHKYLSVCGPASAGKTDVYAVWGIVNFICAPKKTLVLVTSTSLTESKLRVWGSIEEYWRACSEQPGKLNSSQGIIRYQEGRDRTSDKCSIKLVAGDKTHDKKSIGKLIGLKNENVIVIGDELSELSPALVEAVKTNLSSNDRGRFQFIGIANPASVFDPHGNFSTPKAGWKSINPQTDEWETELGYAIRFDAEKSPNIIAGRVLYSYLPKKAWIEEKRKQLGENSPGYWRMVRGFWCPDGSTEGIYSEADITSFGAEETKARWVGQPIPVAGEDPAWTNGGDDTCLQFALFGDTEDGLQTLLLTERLQLVSDTSKKLPRGHQMADQTRDACQKRHVHPSNFAFDETGAGGPYGDILAERWSPEVYRVHFGGAASSVAVGSVDVKPANRRYVNRASEIWFVAKDYIRAGQIKGIDGDVGRDLISRRSKPSSKRGGDELEQVEPKSETRKRTGRSPDRAEAALIILDMLRAKYKFRPQTVRVISAVKARKWDNFLRLNETVERSAIVQLPTSREEMQQYEADQARNLTPFRERTIAVGDGWAENGLR